MVLYRTVIIIFLAKPVAARPVAARAAHNSLRAETGTLAVQHILSETCKLEISIDSIS